MCKVCQTHDIPDSVSQQNSFNDSWQFTWRTRIWKYLSCPWNRPVFYRFLKVLNSRLLIVKCWVEISKQLISELSELSDIEIWNVMDYFVLSRVCQTWESWNRNVFWEVTKSSQGNYGYQEEDTSKFTVSRFPP